MDSIFASELAVNGVATTTDAQRTFLVIQPAGPSQPQVAEIVEGQAMPYPDHRWNDWSSDEPVAEHFVGVNAVRIGPDGALWVVDRGRRGYGEPWVPGAARLLRFDIEADSAPTVFDLASVCTESSFVDDVRIHDDTAYLTDAGQPGLITVNLATSQTRRVLDGHPSTVARSPLIADGEELMTPDGEPVVIHIDQLEVSPDGAHLYYQPCSGGMFVVPTRHLTDADLAGDAEEHVTWFADTPSTGGTAMDSSGRIYLSDVDRRRILWFDPDGSSGVLIEDERLSWVDAMWITEDGRLLMPATQLNLDPAFHHGVAAVRPPIHVYALALGAGPAKS